MARSRPEIPWLGIGSWLLFCGALFVSLLGWSDQTALDRAASGWSSDESDAVVDGTAYVPRDRMEPARAGTFQLPPGASGDLPGARQSPATRPGPAEVQPGANASATGGPPIPRFKPRVDRVAAKFSTAFFEIGDRLQQHGDFDGAVHMRRQGSKLDPWKNL